MKLLHIGIINKDEKESDKFYKDFLRLKRLYEFIIDEELAYSIFKVKEKIRVIKYGNTNFEIEIFLFKEFKREEPDINHICIEIDDNINTFLKRAKDYGIEINIIEREENNLKRKLYFIKDYSGNIYEIKEK